MGERNSVFVPTRNGIVKVTRMDICYKITELRERYEEKSKEEQKEIDKQLRFLGYFLLKNKNRERKISALLRKGIDMSVSEAILLLEMGVNRSQIASHMKINMRTLDGLIREHRKREKQGNEVIPI